MASVSQAMFSAPGSNRPSNSTARKTSWIRLACGIGVALLAAALVLSLGIFAPFQKDQEPLSAQWIQGIVQRGEWLIPSDDYGGIDRKPPLYYWLSALVVKSGLCGSQVEEANARAVSLVAGALLACAAMTWSAIFIGESTGWLALAFLLGTYGFASRATVDLTDMLLSLLLFGVWWCVYFLLDNRKARAIAVIGGVLLGLAILTKGPVAIVLIGFAGLIHLLLTRRPLRQIAAHGWPWLMLAIALAIAACWYVPVSVREGGRAIDLFLIENFGHFLPGAIGGTGEASRPLWYIAARMFGGALPLSLLVPAVVIALWRNDAEPHAREPLVFQASLVLAVLIFFSIASAKRDDYILPALPGLAILFAALFTGAAISPSSDKSAARAFRDLATAAVAIGLLAAIVAALTLGRVGHSPALFRFLQSSDADFLGLFLNGMRHFSAPDVIFSALSLIGALVVAAGLVTRRSIWTGVGTAAMALAGSTLFTGTLRPELARERSMKTFAKEVHHRVGEAPLYVAQGRDDEISFYYGQAVWGLDHDWELNHQHGRTIYVVARPLEWARIAPAIRGRLRPIMRSHLIGGGGPPTLYELAGAPDANDLNSTTNAAKSNQTPEGP
jgi:4-amino-4-deoxy-L-arabinose transferase-like glycosyltransferase